MDYELAYVERRAMEELRAARAATSRSERKSHLALAGIFEERLRHLRPTAE